MLTRLRDYLRRLVGLTALEQERDAYRHACEVLLRQLVALERREVDREIARIRPSSGVEVRH